MFEIWPAFARLRAPSGFSKREHEQSWSGTFGDTLLHSGRECTGLGFRVYSTEPAFKKGLGLLSCLAWPLCKADREHPPQWTKIVWAFDGLMLF